MDMNKKRNRDEQLLKVIALLCVCLAIGGFFLIVDATTTGLIVRWPLPYVE